MRKIHIARHLTIDRREVGRHGGRGGGRGTVERLYCSDARAALLLYARQWRDAAEDVVHEAFTKLAELPSVPHRPLPWLYQVVRNEARMMHRAATRRRRREDRASAGEAWFDAVDEQLDAQRATELLADLPLDLREVIVARLWGGLTFEEIAVLVGCGLGTAHRRYRTGLAELKVRLEGRWAKTSPTAT